MSVGKDKDKDFPLIRRHCVRLATKFFDDFESKRKGVLLDVAREFYPLGVPGLAKSVEELADECPYDEDHRMLSTKPVECLRKGAAGFHGNLTSPARRWFRLRMPSFAHDDAMSNHARTGVMDRLTEAVEWVMSRGNLYASLYKVYEHCLAFGFACMLITKDDERVVKVRTLRVGTYAMGVDADGEVSSVARRFSWTADQIISEFGDDGCPDKVRECARNDDHKTRFTVYNLIEPNGTGFMREYDEVARVIDLDDDMIYRSVYWLECGNDSDPQSGILKISGFRIKPIVAPRMDYEIGDTYGRGRGMDGLDVARGVQSFQYDILKISGNNAQPALIASSEFKESGLKLGRGQVNYARLGESNASLVIPALARQPSSVEVRQDRQDAEQELSDLFFNSAFATIDALKTQTGVKTATEIDALVRENMERLNPVVTNFDKELLDPLVSVITQYSIAAGIVPLSSDDMMQLGSVNVEYVSQIHLAAKQSQIGAIDSWMSRIAGVAQAKPEVMDSVDVDGVSERYADMLGVPASCTLDSDEVSAIRARRAAMVQQEQNRQNAASAGDLSKLASIPTDDAHVGGLLMRGLGAK